MEMVTGRYTLTRRKGESYRAQFIADELGVVGDIHRAKSWETAEQAVKFAKSYKLAGWEVVCLEHRLSTPVGGAIHIHESMIDRPERHLQAV